MLKLYFKKLLSVVMLILMFFCFLFIGFIILQFIAAFVYLSKDNYIWNIAVSLISVLISLIVIYRFRVNNKTKQTAYIKEFSVSEISFSKQIVYILKSKDYFAEILALQTFSLPVSLYAGITEKTPFLPFVVGTILLVLISIILFSIIDIPIWFLVHNKWKKIMVGD